jgi:hypothetical protein
MARKRDVKKESIRNLIQYKDLSDEEFDKYYEDVLLGDLKDERELEERIQERIKELGEDYDIDDLKYNDRIQLRDLVIAMITNDDLSHTLYKETMSGNTDPQSIALIDKLHRAISTTRSDISKIQDDLKLSRKIRQSDKEESVSDYIQNLIKKAKHRYEETLTYIYCPKCRMLVCNIWFQYPENENTVELTCGRNMGDEDNPKICGHKFKVNSKELMKNRGHSIKGVFPNE